MRLRDWIGTAALVLLMLIMLAIAVGLWVVEPTSPVWPPWLD